jgi:hypothetical protein
MVVERICEQWSALTLYFRSEVLQDDVPSAFFILECLDSKIFLTYFKFLKHILTIVIKLNTFFQSESPRFHIFLESITSIYRSTYIKVFCFNLKL